MKTINNYVFVEPGEEIFIINSLDAEDKLKINNRDLYGLQVNDYSKHLY